MRQWFLILQRTLRRHLGLLIQDYDQRRRELVGRVRALEPLQKALNKRQPPPPPGFRVLYHETVDPTVTAAEVLAKKAEAPKPEGDARYYTPLFGVYGIRFAPAEVQRINSQDFRAWDKFLAKWNELHGTDIKTQWDYYRATKISGEFPAPKEKAPYHQMGGYPYFTQEDPRINAGELANLDVLLFQLDSEMLPREQGGGDLVLWGDCGVCNFFINREALRRRDFSRVCYNWDCC